MSDEIKVTEAAPILGVSPKRVRQLIQDGQLRKLGEAPVTVSRKEVLSLHASRQSNATVTRAQVIKKDSTMAILEVIKEMQEAHRLQVAELIAELKSESQKQLLSAEMNQNNLIAEINRLKAENEALSARRGFLSKRKRP